MFSLFRSSKTTPDLSFILADMHSHLLPGLDDGLQEAEHTVEYAKELQQLGYKKLIFTPHILSGMYDNSPETILPKLEFVRTLFAEHNLDMQIEAAAEYMVDADFENHINQGLPLLTFGKNFILIEMSYAAASNNIEQVIFELRLKNLQPILAHPERYSYYIPKPEQYERFVDLGCLLQINLLSLIGYYGEAAKNTAQNLLKKKLVSFVGTDMHHINHLVALKKLAAKKKFYKLFENIQLKNKELLS